MGCCGSRVATWPRAWLAACDAAAFGLPIRPAVCVAAVCVAAALDGAGADEGRAQDDPSAGGLYPGAARSARPRNSEGCTIACGAALAELLAT